MGPRHPERAGISGTTILLEQQADCFAGAWMGHLAADGGPITVNDDTLNLAIAGMVSFSDELGTTATVDGAHGSGFDRVSAFQDGFTNGAAQCATYTTSPPPVIELPFTQSDLATGGNLAFDDIVPLTDRRTSTASGRHVFADRGVAVRGARRRAAALPGRRAVPVVLRRPDRPQPSTAGGSGTAPTATSSPTTRTPSAGGSTTSATSPCRC